MVQGFNCRWVGPVGPLVDTCRLRINWLKALVAFLARPKKVRSIEAPGLTGRMVALQDKILVEPEKKSDVNFNQQRWDLDR